MSGMWYFKSPPNGIVPLGIHLSCLFAVKVPSLTPIPRTTIIYLARMYLNVSMLCVACMYSHCIMFSSLI